MRRALVLFVVFLAGCGFGDEARTIDEASVDELVLRQIDVGAAFEMTVVRPLSDRPSAEVRFRSVRPTSSAEPLAIVSSAEVFPSADEAKRDLDGSRSTIDRRPGWKPISEPGVGDESFAATVAEGPLRYFHIFWRARNATAALRVDGYDEKLALGDVLELARKQQRRISAAES